MPVIRSIPDNKRRVRTGCLCCRKRRRKCDERKPRCTSCETRDVTCTYPDLQFIPKTGDVGEKMRSSSYTRIKFMNESTSPGSRSPESNVISSSTNTNTSTGTGTGTSSDASANTNISPRDSDTLVIRSSYPNISIDSLLATNTPRPEDKKERPLIDWDGYFDTRNVSAVRRQAALLHHFRYRMVPWMDAGDTTSRFGVDIMYLAQEHPPIQNVIVELAASQVDLIHRKRDGSHGSQDSSVGRGHDLEGPAKRIADSLSGITDYLGSGPLQWRRLASNEIGLLGPELTATSIDEPLRFLCKFHSRFDLASSILLRQPPLTPRSFYAQQSFPPAWDDFHGTYIWALHHLTTTLYFIHDPSQPLPSSILQDPSHQSMPPFSSYPNSSAKWLTLWKSCQTWRETRPLPMRPVLDIGNIEAGQIDSRADASFPIQLYTNALGILANVAYHMSSLLMLLHKPRLLKLSGYQLLTSQSWHVQAIAGICCTNDFAEQWDPIVVAALLFIARDMTHAAQQGALGTCFEKIGRRTGISLEREVGELRAGWSAGRFG